jgi:DNA-binding response OmpR family regulator
MIMSARILVVDDEEPVSSMLKIVLESNEYAVTTAGSAAEAVRMLRGETFDLVVTDMKMESDTAGYEVVRTARALPNRRDWRALGADAAISKPSQMTTLLELVGGLLQKRRDQTPHASESA